MPQPSPFAAWSVELSPGPYDMKEFFDIVSRYDELAGAGHVAALATVVRAAGSTYRLPGARMLISSDGVATGCVSGGCLERDVIENAQRALAAGAPRMVVYDTRDDDEGDWTFGLGCKGRVDVLIEPLHDDGTNPIRFIDRCYRARRDGVIATIVGAPGAAAPQPGQRLLVTDAGVEATSITDGVLSGAIARDAAEALASDSIWNAYDLPGGGRVDVFVERIRRPLRLVVFGCGHDAAPLVRLARELGWPVAIVDYRPRNLARARGLGVADVISARPDDFAGPRAIAATAFDDRTAAIVMNHNYADDRTILEHLLTRRLGYVGLLGPRARTAQLMRDVRPAAASRASGPGCIHGPVGLDIGAAGPEEIAVSVVAEILAVFSGRGGGHASNRVAPLHSRDEADHGGAGQGGASHGGAGQGGAGSRPVRTGAHLPPAQCGAGILPAQDGSGDPERRSSEVDQRHA